MVCWSLTICGISLGVAWYAAYLRGLFRGTPAFQTLTLSYPSAIVRTEHPSLLGAGGIALIAGGIAVAMALLRFQPNSLLARWTGTSRRRPVTKRVAGLSLPMLLPGAVIALTYAGVLALTVPGLHSYKDPLLVLRTPRMRLVSLVAQPVIPLTMLCQPPPCTIQKLRITQASPYLREQGDADPPGSDVAVGKTIRLMSELPAAHVSTRTLGRRFGEPLALYVGLGFRQRRFTVKQSEIVEIPPQSRDDSPLRRARDPSAASAGALATRAFVYDAERRYRPIFDGLSTRSFSSHPGIQKVLAIVVADGDLRRLISSIVQRRALSISRLDMTVQMGNGVKQAVQIPLRVL